MSSVDVKINNTVHYGVEEVYIPKADNSGDAVFVLSGNVVPHLDITGIMQRTAVDIDDIDGFVTGQIAAYITRYQSNLETVNLPNATVVQAEAFRGNTKLTSVSMQSCTTLANHAFNGCSSLSIINFPSLLTTGEGTFYGCSSLQSVSLPLLTKVGNSCFYGCSSLQSVNIPLVSNVADAGFAYCTNLENITLPSVTYIGQQAFKGCTKLEKIIITQSSSVPNLHSSMPFSGTLIEGGTGYIYVPDALVDSYKAKSPWSTYAAQIKGLSELPQD